MRTTTPILFTIATALLAVGCSKPAVPTEEEKLMATMSITEKGLIGTWKGSLSEEESEGLPETMTNGLAAELGGYSLEVSLSGSERRFMLSLVGYVIEGDWVLRGEDLLLTPNEDVAEPLDEDLNEDGQFSFGVIEGGEEILWTSESGSPITFIKTE